MPERPDRDPLDGWDLGCGPRIAGMLLVVIGVLVTWLAS
jgi:hypothetical protein